MADTHRSRAMAREPPAQTELAAACQQALVAGARAEGAGTRQQVRAAARRFVRRNRRDASYLRWVLRSVAASSALAVALLGLSAAPAAAAGTLFAEQAGVANPLDGVDVGSYSTTALGDLDADGDLDLVASKSDGHFHYFENTGSATSPAFDEQVGGANPLDGLDAGSYAVLSLGDLDGDGDLDLVAGETTGAFHYFENTGSATSPGFVEQTGTANPLDVLNVGLDAAPALADLDGDGDLDLVAGSNFGTLRYYENTDGATSPAFVERTGAANPFDGETVGNFAAPSLGDLDGDGDLDLVAGRISGTFGYLENRGNATSPVFVARPDAANPLDGETVFGFSTPTLGDLDGDGDLDLVAGDNDGTFGSFENLAGGFVERTGTANPLDGEDIGLASNAALGDLDGDGDLDLVSGEFDGSFFYFENTGNVANPAFLERTAGANPLDGQVAGFASNATLGDLDGDGDLDLVAGEVGGTFHYFENTGSAMSPAFAEQTGTANPLDGVDLGEINSAPALGDLDGDGDLDLAAGAYSGTIRYYENTGSATSPAFDEKTGTANPLHDLDVGGVAAPALGDVDGDGDLDLVAGERDGSFLYLENTGSATSPAFSEQIGGGNPLDGQDVGNYSTPALGDLDGDGDLDLISGEAFGTFHYFENAIVQPSLAVLERTGVANPLDGEDVGLAATPTLGDVDADGDLDLVAGKDSGRFLFFENTGDATLPAYLEQTGGADPLAGLDVGLASTPALGDLDGDGDLDLVSGKDSGRLLYFANTGDATLPAYVEQTGAASPLDGLDVGLASAPALGDLDGDGDLDCIAGKDSGRILYYENTGSATSPAFMEQTGMANPLDGLDVGLFATPALGDVDADGDLDCIAGDQQGTLHYYENTGSATMPAFVERTGAANPLDGEDVGSDAAPALGDIDANGTLNLVAGAADGTFTVYELPEPGQGLLLSAGLAALAWLDRLRRRRER